MWNVIGNKKSGTSMMFWGRNVNPNWLSLISYARVIPSGIRDIQTCKAKRKKTNYSSENKWKQARFQLWTVKKQIERKTSVLSSENQSEQA